MDIIYASLNRRTRVHAEPKSEVSEVLDALWAHTTPEDGLEHASGRAERDRVDVLMCLLTLDPTAPGFRSTTHRANSLLRRCHAASPLMRRRYLPPDASA
ncbi:hypothetical protein ACFWWM_31835 [Streptomyces sp. NPDC058682]|uniref:hypothetical protein n=1 Tax=unclassified Streptomyces TaxID=2593676 RepID=UPI002257355E|nr:hypothetical protein [Streptomyces sp. NBC_01214]MCX4801335.1 hypothetical protein [Streptomyces sp. NBC_01214]